MRPIRDYNTSGSLQTFFEWFDTRVEWSDLIIVLCVLLLILLVADIKRKGDMF